MKKSSIQSLRLCGIFVMVLLLVPLTLAEDKGSKENADQVEEGTKKSLLYNPAFFRPFPKEPEIICHCYKCGGSREGGLRTEVFPAKVEFSERNGEMRGFQRENYYPMAPWDEREISQGPNQLSFPIRPMVEQRPNFDRFPYRPEPNRICTPRFVNGCHGCNPCTQNGQGYYVCGHFMPF